MPHPLSNNRFGPLFHVFPVDKAYFHFFLRLTQRGRCYIVHPSSVAAPSRSSHSPSSSEGQILGILFFSVDILADPSHQSRGFNHLRVHSPSSALFCKCQTHRSKGRPGISTWMSSRNPLTLLLPYTPSGPAIAFTSRRFPEGRLLGQRSGTLTTLGTTFPKGCNSSHLGGGGPKRARLRSDCSGTPGPSVRQGWGGAGPLSPRTRTTLSSLKREVPGEP